MSYKTGDFVKRNKIRYYNRYNGFTVLHNSMVFTSVAAMDMVRLGQHHYNITQIIEPHSTIYMLEDPESDTTYLLQNYKLDLGGVVAVLKYDENIGTYTIVKEQRYMYMDKGSMLYRDEEDKVKLRVVNNYNEEVTGHIVINDGYINTELHYL